MLTLRSDNRKVLKTLASVPGGATEARSGLGGGRPLLRTPEQLPGEIAPEAMSKPRRRRLQRKAPGLFSVGCRFRRAPRHLWRRGPVMVHRQWPPLSGAAGRRSRPARGLPGHAVLVRRAAARPAAAAQAGSFGAAPKGRGAGGAKKDSGKAAYFAPKRQNPSLRNSPEPGKRSQSLGRRKEAFFPKVGAFFRACETGRAPAGALCPPLVAARGARLGGAPHSRGTLTRRYEPRQEPADARPLIPMSDACRRPVQDCASPPPASCPVRG